jgi:hypothetical protein
MMTTRRSFLAVAALAALAMPATGGAQELPDAQQVLARYHQAIGGAAAMEGRNSYRVVGEVQIPAVGITGSFEAFSARPNRAAQRVQIPGFGELLTGYTGRVGWSINPAEGPRLMTGGEALQLADEADFESSLRHPGVVASMTTVERTRLAGRECIKVRVAWKSGRETFDCYSEQTGLLVGTMAKQETNMGVVDAVTLYDDYRDFDGVRMAGRITIQVMGMDQIITVSEMHFNQVPDSAFEPPAAIKALIGG